MNGLSRGLLNTLCCFVGLGLVVYCALQRNPEGVAAGMLLVSGPVGVAVAVSRRNGKGESDPE